MLKAITTTVRLSKSTFYRWDIFLFWLVKCVPKCTKNKKNDCRSAPALSSSTKDPIGRKEAPIIDNESVFALPEEAKEKSALESTICVPIKVICIL